MSAYAADWPQWRGPNRDGISAQVQPDGSMGRENHHRARFAGIDRHRRRVARRVVLRLPQQVPAGFVQRDHGSTRSAGRDNHTVTTAMKFLTGEVAWRNRSVGKGSVTYAEGRLYALSEDGVMGLIDATPQEYQERSRFELHRGSYPTWTPPVIANGKLYLRDEDNLYCYDIHR